ncbi:MAG: hypothetical protein U0031_11300 [Thermomicrobiales bacterium]
MTHRVPADLRERAGAAVEGEQRRFEVLRAYGIAPRTLDRWLDTHGRGEVPGDRTRSGRPRKIAPAAYPALAAQVAARDDTRLAARCDRWTAKQGVPVSPTTMGRVLATLDLPLCPPSHHDAQSASEPKC